MSKYAGAILTIVGTVVGAYFGGPLGASLGATLGGLVGSLAFPQNNSTTGPRLADITSTTSSVGVGIPRGWGTFVLAGNFIAQSDLREVMVTTDSGGKGGTSTSTTTPTYFQDFAIGLSDTGSPENRRIVKGVRTIWANGKAIYDRRPRIDTETDSAYQSRLAASDQLEKQFVFYQGTDDQLPDPTLEAFYGVGNISAFRGLAYIVFINWQNKAEDGNRIPSTWQFELYNAGDSTGDTLIEYTNEVLYPWINSDPPLNPVQAYTYSARSPVQGGGNDSTPQATVEAALALIPLRYKAGSGIGYIDYNPHADMTGFANYATSKTGGALITDVAYSQAMSVLLHYNDVGPVDYEVDPSMGGGGATTTLALVNTPHQKLPVRQAYGDGWNSNDNEMNGAVYGLSESSGGIGPGGDATFYRSLGWDTLVSSGSFSVGDLYISYDCILYTTRAAMPPPDPCDATPGTPVPMSDGSYPAGGDAAEATTIPGIDGFVLVNGELRKCGPWTKTNGTWRVLQALTLDNSDTTNIRVAHWPNFGGVLGLPKYPLGPARPSGHADYDDETFWTAQYDLAVARKRMSPGLVYGVDYPFAQGYAYQRSLDLSTTDTLPAIVSDVVSDICQEASYAPADLDVTDIEDMTVAGYIRTGQMTGRAAIAPLAQIKFFDGIESETKLKFVARGKATTFALALNDDLGCVVAGADPIAQIQIQSADETDIPRSVTVAYLSPLRDYQTGSQVSPTTMQTTSVNDLNVTFPGILSDDEAKAAATRLWAIGRVEADQYTSTIDGGRQEIEPADCGTIPIDGLNQRVRITAIADSLPITRALTMVRDDSVSYTPTPIASVPPYVPAPIKLNAPATAYFLDLPALVDTDDDPGFYVAFRAQLAGSYRGAALFRSTDEGASYAQVCAATNEATIGQTLSVIPAADFDTWDQGTTIEVELGAGTFSSATQAAVLGGANVIAVGVDGRWELIQFTTATLVTGKIWNLSGLLRGRRGTEQFIGTGAIGDTVVLVSGPGIVRAALAITSVGRPYLYRSVATGMSLDQAVDQSFTGHGVALKPFSVADLQAARNDAGDWAFSWIRRSRIGETLRSGVDLPLNEDDEDYEIDVLAGDGSVLRTISSSSEALDYIGDEQIADFGTHQSTISINVYQVSAQVGRGYGAGGTFSRAIPVAPGTQTSTLQLVFGGVPNSIEATVIEVRYVPNAGGVGTFYLFELAGGSPDGITSRAAELADQMTTTLAGIATVTQTLENVTATSTTGILDAKWAHNLPFAAGWCSFVGFPGPGGNNAYSVQAAAAPSSTNEGFYGVDLYGMSGPAPTSDPSFNAGGTYRKTFLVKNVDADLQLAFIGANSPPGTVVAGDYCQASVVKAVVAWSLSAHTGSGDRGLAAIFTADGTSGIADAINAHPVLSPIVDTVSVTGGRPCVQITLKDGWAFVDDGNSTALGDPTPSGWTAETSTITGGIPVKAYSAGRAQIDTVNYAYQLSPFSGTVLSPECDIAIGQTFRVTIGGVNFDHAVDSTDMLDVSPIAGQPHFFDRIMGDIAGQINATGTYQATLIERNGVRIGSPSADVLGMAVRAVAGNSAYDFEASVEPAPGLTITITSSITH